MLHLSRQSLRTLLGFCMGFAALGFGGCGAHSVIPSPQSGGSPQPADHSKYADQYLSPTIVGTDREYLRAMINATGAALNYPTPPDGVFVLVLSDDSGTRVLTNHSEYQPFVNVSTGTIPMNETAMANPFASQFSWDAPYVTNTGPYRRVFSRAAAAPLNGYGYDQANANVFAPCGAVMTLPTDSAHIYWTVWSNGAPSDPAEGGLQYNYHGGVKANWQPYLRIAGAAGPGGNDYLNVAMNVAPTFGATSTMNDYFCNQPNGAIHFYIGLEMQMWCPGNQFLVQAGAAAGCNPNPPSNNPQNLMLWWTVAATFDSHGAISGITNLAYAKLIPCTPSCDYRQDQTHLGFGQWTDHCLGCGFNRITSIAQNTQNLSSRSTSGSVQWLGANLCQGYSTSGPTGCHAWSTADFPALNPLQPGCQEQPTWYANTLNYDCYSGPPPGVLAHDDRVVKVTYLGPDNEVDIINLKP